MIVLKTGMAGGKMVYMDAKGTLNPTIKGNVGDTVEITITSGEGAQHDIVFEGLYVKSPMFDGKTLPTGNSKAVHSIDLHSATGGLGGGEHTQVAPGQTKTITFKALNLGLYVYHCATPSVAQHISAGMYGLILVEPKGGPPKVDKEFYVIQGDLYTSHAFGTKGHHEYSHDRAGDELRTYYTFNDSVGALGKEHKMEAMVVETVRVYFGVGGPNKVSSFHVIGEIFDKVYSEGSTNTVKANVQTTLVPAGGATIVDFKVQYPGKFILADHALSRAGKGLAGVMEVKGEEDAKVYKPSHITAGDMAN